MVTLQEIARLAAHILNTSDATRIYLGYPRLTEPRKTHPLQRVPFLTIEHYNLTEGERLGMRKKDAIARIFPENYHRYVFGFYGLSPRNDITLFRMNFCPSLTEDEIPFLFERWKIAFDQGWRFRRRGNTGSFKKDSLQLHRNPQPNNRERARLLQFPPLPQS